MPKDEGKKPNSHVPPITTVKRETERPMDETTSKTSLQSPQPKHANGTAAAAPERVRIDALPPNVHRAQNQQRRSSSSRSSLSSTTSTNEDGSMDDDEPREHDENLKLLNEPLPLLQDSLGSPKKLEQLLLDKIKQCGVLCDFGSFGFFDFLDFNQFSYFC